MHPLSINLEKIENSSKVIDFLTKDIIFDVVRLEWSFLTLIKNSENFRFSFWLDSNFRGANRYLNIQISKENLLKYLNREIDLKQVVELSLEKNIGIIYDIDNNSKIIDARYIGLEFLDMIEYVHSDASYFDITYSNMNQEQIKNFIKEIQLELKS